MLTDVQAKAGEKLTSVLTDRDDPTGKARKLLPDWAVTEHLPIFLQHDGGGITPCNFYRIWSGDFVDVIVSVDVVQRAGKKDLAVGLILHQVVQLKTGAVATKVLSLQVDGLR